MVKKLVCKVCGYAQVYPSFENKTRMGICVDCYFKGRKSKPRIQKRKG